MVLALWEQPMVVMINIELMLKHKKIEKRRKSEDGMRWAIFDL